MVIGYIVHLYRRGSSKERVFETLFAKHCANQLRSIVQHQMTATMEKSHVFLADLPR